MGLTSWCGAKVRKQDVGIAKNYLGEDELLALNKLAKQLWDCKRGKRRS